MATKLFGFAAVNARKTHCPKGHALAGANLRVTAKGLRACRQCDNDHSIDFRKRARAIRALEGYTRALPGSSMFDDIIVERFWSRVDKTAGEDGCWPWTARLSEHGYGLFKVQGRWRPASRYALSLQSKEMPPKTILALHSCDNPPCCNPAHLRWGDNKDNGRDMVSRGRATNPNANLTPDQVRTIRADPRSAEKVAQDYGLSPTTIWNIRHRQKWSDIA